MCVCGCVSVCPSVRLCLCACVRVCAVMLSVSSVVWSAEQGNREEKNRARGPTQSDDKSIPKGPRYGLGEDFLKTK